MMLSDYIWNNRREDPSPTSENIVSPSPLTPNNPPRPSASLLSTGSPVVPQEEETVNTNFTTPQLHGTDRLPPSQTMNVGAGAPWGMGGLRQRPVIGLGGMEGFTGT